MIAWQVSNLELSKKLRELGVKQKSFWRWVNAQYSSGFEGETGWICNGKWEITQYIPDPNIDFTGIITKEEGLIPDYFNSDHDTCYEKMKSKIEDIEVISAFTVAELGCKFPSYIQSNAEGYRHSLERIKTERNGGHFVCYFKHITEGLNIAKIKIIEFSDSTEANTRAKMLIWLIENEYIEV